MAADDPTKPAIATAKLNEANHPGSISPGSLSRTNEI
jgi:hypothetical protein